MSDKLDNDLKNRIREVFDHYEDDTANAGWELLRQRFPEEKKRRVVAWWWYSAAAVLLLCLGTWFFYPQNTTQQTFSRHKTTVNKTGANNSETTPVNNGEAVAINKGKVASSEANQTTALSSDATDQQQANTTSVKAAAASITGNKGTGNKTLAEPMNGTLFMAARGPYKNRLPGKNEIATSQSQVVITPEKITNDGLFNAVKTDQGFARINQQRVVASQSASVADSVESTTAKMAVAQQPAKANQASVVVQKTDPVLKMIAADDARRQAMAKNATGNKKSETVKGDRSVIMSLYAGTYFNYAKGSQSQLGVGGGFSSDFRISDNFKISTGVSIGQNRLSYSSDNTIPQQITNQALAMVNKSAAAMASYSLVTSLRSATPEVQTYNASLVGLDIPLNIKYQFNPKKNDTYISAGISSGTFINETYHSAYTNSNNVYPSVNNSLSLSAVNSVTQQTQENTSSQHFGSFDFARTLNVSFGMGYPLGRNRLVIEPFLKYPLSGLGTQDIKFGASGINLKLSFSTSKK